MFDWLGWVLIMVFCEDYNALSASCPTTPWKVVVKVVLLASPILVYIAWKWPVRRCSERR